MSEEHFLDDRRKALENSFFRNLEKENLEKLRAAYKEQTEIEQLQKACGINDTDTLHALTKLGISPETMAALSLTPLVEVAWADNKMEEAEREAILKAAHQNGLVDESPSFDLLREWLNQKPEQSLFTAWAAYTQDLTTKLSEQEARALKLAIVGKAQRVAEAAGGFLGLGNKISDEEQATLERIASTFG